MKSGRNKYMSKIGKKPIEIKNGISTTVTGNMVKIIGPKGQFEYQIPEGLELVVEEGKVTVRRKNKNDSKADTAAQMKVMLN